MAVRHVEGLINHIGVYDSAVVNDPLSGGSLAVSPVTKVPNPRLTDRQRKYNSHISGHSLPLQLDETHIQILSCQTVLR